MINQVRHSTIDLDGVEVFFREAGRPDAPAVLLPHGYPCSSYEFRDLMPRLADRWRLVAPDFPGCGYTRDPDDFRYDFDGYAQFLASFTERLGIDRFAIWLHDFGSQIGLRLAIAHPERITAVIIQNGDIYEDVLGPKYDDLRQLWTAAPDDAFRRIRSNITRDEFAAEFRNDLDGETSVDLIPPDLWELHWSLMTERRKDIAASVIAGLKDNVAWFPRYQRFLREHRPPALILWGPKDGYMPEASARAYLRDLPDAELHLLDAGHWLLEVQLDEAVRLCRDFLQRTIGPS